MNDGIESLRQQLEDATDLIRQKDEAILDLKRQLQDAEDRLSNERTTIEYDVNMDKGRYPNDAARKAAIGRAMLDSMEARMAQGEVNELQAQIGFAQIQRDDASRMRQNILAVIAYAASANYRMAPALVGAVGG